MSLTLDARAFAFYREKARHWLVEDSSFTPRVGLSSAEFPRTARVARKTTVMLPV